MWKGDEMGKGESNIPSLQVCWGKEHCKDLTSGNHLSRAGKRTAGNFLALGEDEKTKTMCHTHTYARTRTHTHSRSHTRQWYNDYYTYSPPLSLPSLNLMIFRYTPLHGQKHAVTWLVKAAVYVHFQINPRADVKKSKSVKHRPPGTLGRNPCGFVNKQNLNERHHSN